MTKQHAKCHSNKFKFEVNIEYGVLICRLPNHNHHHNNHHYDYHYFHDYHTQADQ